MTVDEKIGIFAAINDATARNPNSVIAATGDIWCYVNLMPAEDGRRDRPMKLFQNSKSVHFGGKIIAGKCPVCLGEFVCTEPKKFREKGWGYCKQCGQKIDMEG